MASDAIKHFEKARRLLEKNKLREAATEYQSVLDDVPSNQEAIQALADIYTRLNEHALAAEYYGKQFDRLVESGDASRATAIFTRFLRSFPQPPDRLAQYALQLQKQNRTGEAIEQFGASAQLYQQQARDIEALACYESMALLDPENPSRHVILGELAERLGHRDLATRSYLRSGQLTQASGGLDEALEYFNRAHRLSPQDRTGALLFAEARLRKGDAKGCVALLDPIAANEKDTAFLALFGEALLRTHRLDRAREVFEAYYKQKPEGFSKLFELAGAHILDGDESKAAALLLQTKDLMRSHRRETELVAHMDQMAAMYPTSLPVAEVVARLYDELNRETKYFDALVRLFDLYLEAGKIKPACDALDRLVDIDPYDYRNHERIARLEGKTDPAFLQNILARAAKAATVSTRPDGFSGAGSDQGANLPPVTEEARAQQALEDLSVQVEIFLQYSLQSKAVERLQRIAELFPGEEEKNEKLRSLYDRASWWPKGAPPKPRPAPVAPLSSAIDEMLSPPSAGVSSATPAETHRDLAAIAEINRVMYRQSTPREVLTSTAVETGKHLGVTRCLVTVGGSGEARLSAEYAAAGFQPAGTPRIAAIAELISKLTPDALGGIELGAATNPELRDFGLSSALGVVLTDKETQLPAGALVVGSSQVRQWKPNESFFLQAVGDQLVLSVNHSRLRSLVRSLAVADERTGLLSRGAYVDCLLMESNRARSQGTALSLIVLQVDRGGDLLRQHGDAAVDHFIEQLAKALSSSVRQTDVAVKYTAWSLVFILPDTSFENARALAEKLRQVAATVQPSWGAQDLTISAVVAQSTSRPADETEDRVTEWMNRAEAGIDEARQRGGNTLVELAAP